MMEIPSVNLKAQNCALKTEILLLWEEILDSAVFVNGKYVKAFEEEFADACSVKRSVMVNSGTDALRFIFIALDLNPGDEVITTPYTFIATTEAITQAGGKIVFVDIDPDTYNIDPSRLESAITSRTKGIVPVHLYGQTAEMDSILSIADKHALWVVEDACQAHLAEYKGRKAGTMGVAGAFSFYPSKNLGGCGEGGAVATNDDKLADKIQIIRDHGQVEKYYHEMEGYNGRCDALQAAVLRVKLKYLPAWNEARRRNAQDYFQLLQDIDSIVLPHIDRSCLHVFHLFVVQVENRDIVHESLGKVGISTGLHYPIPLHLQKAYAYMGLEPGSFPVAEKCAKRLLSLPMFPELTREQICLVSNNLKRSLNINNV